ncbi:MAG: signal peptidase I [Rhabdochlamydiaceae bacterium]|nr:signal peptidase I [Candidatus Amphrikana amoebophyrae]
MKSILSHNPGFCSVYRLKKSRSIFYHTIKIFRKRRKRLRDDTREEIHNTLSTFQDTLISKNTEGAHNLAKKCELLSKLHLKKTFFDHILEVFFALVFALVVATVVRQMWFEFYQIPSGSMRPTLKENDRLLVSKTQFGINIPLMLKHFMFKPEEVKRNGIFIFNGENMDIPDNYTRYFYLFPGYKQYVKRVMGKPGDTLYFYGGQIYGFDKNGKDITQELQPDKLANISHVPFMSFEGKVKFPNRDKSDVISPVLLYQMNLPVAKMYLSPLKQIKYDILYSAEKNAKPVDRYGALWGFNNYATAQIVNKKGKYQLEFQHSPSLKNAKLVDTIYHQKMPVLTTSKSAIPLDDRILRIIYSNMTTARFVVKDGTLRRHSSTNPPIKKGVANNYPKFDGIPNGTYEFIDGVPYRIYWQGISKQVPPSHPLAEYSAKKAAFFFNMGMSFDVRLASETMMNAYPSRYAFFRHNSLFLMDKVLLTHTDPALVTFVNRELQRQKSSADNYIPFIDKGPPITNKGELDMKFIKRTGLKIPEGHYLALGDNYSMSFDSRGFGFVPQDNVKGVPEFIFWPPGSQMGFLHQPLYPLFTLSRIIIWCLALIVFIIWGIISSKRHSLPTNIPK